MWHDVALEQAPITIPTFVDIWKGAQDLVHLWNNSGVGVGIQYVILACTIYVGMRVVIRVLRSLNSDEDFQSSVRAPSQPRQRIRRSSSRRRRR